VAMLFSVGLGTGKTPEPEVVRLMTSLMTSATCFHSGTYMLLTLLYIRWVSCIFKGRARVYCIVFYFNLCYVTVQYQYINEFFAARSSRKLMFFYQATSVSSTSKQKHFSLMY